MILIYITIILQIFFNLSCENTKSCQSGIPSHPEATCNSAAYSRRNVSAAHRKLSPDPTEKNLD